jgi:hypothetical protein
VGVYGVAQARRGFQVPHESFQIKFFVSSFFSNSIYSHNPLMWEGGGYPKEWACQPSKLGILKQYMKQRTVDLTSQCMEM